MALCVGAIVGPLAGLVLAPFAFLGAACALMSIVLACVQVHETSPPKPKISAQIDDAT
jgi:uncharacterized membrane protein YoaK (UPF0700 family)